ncbi:putative cell division protein FtsL [Treponema primitia ZAS-2]|uniref:Putative cell division protein FtsL n=1 Tax=Treponema primitia (strain ATCC BAA-887 / DSM 12427 / ZAS-2) TaxID=545694 RepID=F5YGK4_TREPZ|nr:cell division protein FtsL [Treponema primitia]AEF85816.1 putative cell division protein FtsL [Treponema primitia ZAS-2]
MRRFVSLYVFVLTLPLFLAGSVWQARRYTALQRDVRRLEVVQEEWIESNKRLIAGIGLLSSAERIEHIAIEELGLMKKQPEDVLQVRIEAGRGRTDG